MRDLTSWDDIIQEVGRKRQLDEDAALQRLKDGYDEQVRKLKTFDNAFLLKYFQAHSQRGCADPRQTKIYQDVAAEAERELLRRLNLATNAIELLPQVDVTEFRKQVAKTSGPVVVTRYGKSRFIVTPIGRELP